MPRAQATVVPRQTAVVVGVGDISRLILGGEPRTPDHADDDGRQEKDCPGPARRFHFHAGYDAPHISEALPRRVPMLS